jgi:hypothetical protein
MREPLRRLCGLAMLGLAAACGGNLSTGPGDGGAGAGSTEDAAQGGGTPGSSPGESSGGSSSGGGSSGGGFSSSGSSGGPPGFPIETIADDGGCAPDANIVTHQSPNPESQACWACVSKGCATQLTACANDCACNAAVASVEECVDQGDPNQCLAPLPLGDQSDETLATTSNCLMMASFECSCGDNLPDASDPGCTQTGGGGSGGNGECSSNFGETCGGVNYQVICACPEGSCVCFSQSSSTKVVTFNGCPYCPGGAAGGQTANDLYDLCGFPH